MKNSIVASLVLVCVLVGTATASQIGSLSWNRTNIATLRSFDKTAVVKFLNEWGGMEGRIGALTPQEVWEFGWVDLAGDGKYELVLTSSSGPCCVYLGIYTQNNLGKVRAQSFDSAGRLSDSIRDLNGDGKKELILWKELAEPGTWFPMADTPRWPAVYRLENGKYVEASRDFPNFYDTEILPALNKSIATRQQRATPNGGYSGALAREILEKDKVLRLLGRDPTAGLNHAYQWMNSDDPQLLQCAVATFRDVGGHDKEMRAAEQKIGPAIDHEIAGRKGG